MKSSEISRRTFIKRSILTGAALALAPSIHMGTARAQAKGRVIILGFDGMEPDIAQTMMEAGELPNLAKLQGAGAFSRLASTIPPQSPVAWSSFAACKNPGAHNIFDFIRRDPSGPRGPMPYVGTGKVEHARLNADGTLASLPIAETYRKGASFWSVADQQGLRCKILNVPFVFPPEPLKHGAMLCALGVPDLRGTTSTFFALSDAFTPAQLEERLSGGIRIKLEFDGSDETEVSIPGPRDSRNAYSAPNGFALAPLRVAVDRKAGKGTARAGEAAVELTQGEWSPFLEWEFKLSPSYSVRSLTRFYPMEIGAQVRIYMSCQQYHPKAPYSPISEPNEFAAAIAERYGLYKTIGWTYDTHALRSGELTEDAFLADVRATMAWRERLTLDELDRGDFDLLISAWTATDRMGHMFWRFRDEKHPLYDPEGAKRYGRALEDCYKQADRIVGNVMARAKDSDLLMVMSDHGFGTWRTGFNINTWLRDQGYLHVSDPALADRGFLMGIDWAQTKAYSVGLSSLYLNLGGRESQGCVAPDRAEALARELAGKLAEVKDPATGAKVFSRLYTREHFRGEAMAEAPDMVLGYDRNYQSSKPSAMGGVPEGLFETNDDKWSGEHAATDKALLPGLLTVNRRFEKTDPHIQDLGATALAYLGCDVPTDFEGEAIV